MAESDLAHTFRHRRALATIASAGLAALWALSGLYAVGLEQRGVVKRFGRLVEEDVPPGIHYCWPWPIESVERPSTTQIRSLTVAFSVTEGPAGESDLLLTGDENLVLSSLLMQFTIKNPSDFLNRTQEPERLLSRLLRDRAIVRFARTGVDEALTTGRQQIQLSLRDEVQAECDRLALGVRVTSVQIQKIEPPAAVASAFKEVASAREDKQKLVEEAEGDRNRRLPEARSAAERMRSESEAHAKEAVAFSEGDAQRFLSAWQQYQKSGPLTGRRLYLEALEELLPRVRKVVANPRAEGPRRPGAL